MKIAIVGTSPSTEHLAPFNDTGWQIWGLARRVGAYRLDKAFEVHQDVSVAPKGYIEQLESLEIPVVVGYSSPIKTGELFPYEKARELMGYDYFTSTASYMIALAIIEEATEIAIYGIDMAVDNEEYFKQRACAEKWIGIAKGKGIKVTIPEQSPLCKSSFIYGQTDSIDIGIFTESEFRKIADEHLKKISQLQEVIRNAELQIEAHSGANQAYTKMAEVARAIRAGNKIQSLTHALKIK